MNFFSKEYESEKILFGRGEGEGKGGGGGARVRQFFIYTDPNPKQNFCCGEGGAGG